MLVLAAGGPLEPQGPVAESMANLWWFMLIVGTAVFVLVMALLLGGLFRRRPAAGPEPAAECQEARRPWIVVGGVVMPTVVLVVVLVATVVGMRDVPDEAPADALVVEVVGHQWWYEVRYPDAGVTTANEIHIPVGRPISFQLFSDDVIHSFWVPALAGKVDMLPDHVNTLVLEADEPGEHQSECAEFCGLQHANMGVTVVAEPAEEFASWLADEGRPAANPAGAAAQRGEGVFRDEGCASCHGVRGATEEATEGPDLTHLAGRTTIAAGAAPNTTGALAEWITDPHAIKEGVDMPATDLSAKQRQDLVAYLKGLE